MNTNDHRDKEERLREDEGREEDRKIRVAPEIARGCTHGGPRKAEPGPMCHICVCSYALAENTSFINLVDEGAEAVVVHFYMHV